MNFLSVGELYRATTYHFTVIAINVVGDSDPSAASESSSATTLTTKPSAPTDVDARNPTAKCIDVAWSAPADNGGADISEYHLYVKNSEDSPLHSDAGFATTAELSHTWCGLNRATTYYAWVIAVNAKGAGPVSE